MYYRFLSRGLADTYAFGRDPSQILRSRPFGAGVFAVCAFASRSSADALGRFPFDPGKVLRFCIEAFLGTIGPRLFMASSS